MCIRDRVVAVAGCSDETPKPRSTRAERAAKAEELLLKTPLPRTYAIGANQLLVLEIPVKDSTNFVDIQRCFVWRDTELKTSSISCGQQPEILLSN